MNRLMRKLENFAPLSEDDKRLLDDVIRAPHEVAARTTLVREGDAPDHVHLILDGFACRYKVTSGGMRHIMAYLVPGDFCDLHRPDPQGNGPQHRDALSLPGGQDLGRPHPRDDRAPRFGPSALVGHSGRWLPMAQATVQYVCGRTDASAAPMHLSLCGGRKADHA